MEQDIEHQVTARSWDSWDAVPRDGPAVFIIDTAALDHGELHGCWIDPTLPSDILGEQLRRLVGYEPAEGSFAIVDQVGLGDRMLPETLKATELWAEGNRGI